MKMNTGKWLKRRSRGRKKKEENIRKRILLPLGIALLTGAAVAVLVADRIHNAYTELEARQKLKGAQRPKGARLNAVLSDVLGLPIRKYPNLLLNKIF